MDTLAGETARGPRVERAGLNEDTFTRLYQDQLKSILNYVRYRLGAEEAEDITAEIFARVWARRRRYDPGRGEPRTWLWAIARNAVIDRLRRNRPRRVDIPSHLAGPHDPSAELDRQEEWYRIQTALAQLKPVDQEIIALRFGAGRTNRAIARMLDLSEANVAQRLRRALRKTRMHLQGRSPP